MAAEEPAAKKARVEEDATEGAQSYYKVIDGVKYDRKLLESAEAFAKDGQISYTEARHLFLDAQDGQKFTDTERQTLEYALKTMKFSEKAAGFMKTALDHGTHKSYYKQIDGVKYDRELLEAAELFASDGQISTAEAKQLFNLAYDGKGMTDIERQTLEYALKTLKFTDKAAAYTRTTLDGGKVAGYYKQIDGVKYDRELLETAVGYAADGQVSYPEMVALWDDAQDGKGVTETEKRTFDYIMKNCKCTDKALRFLRGVLGLEPEEKEEKPATSYYKQVDGVKYDRGLLEAAEAHAKDGQVSFAEAKELWEDAQDGKGVTEVEKRTLEHALKTLKFTDKAAGFLRKELDAGKHTSYYKIVDGQRYDRELLEQTETFAKDGQVGLPEAKQLWEAAQDGKGVTKIEKLTFAYAMKTIKFSEPATEYLNKLLEN